MTNKRLWMISGTRKRRRGLVDNRLKFLKVDCWWTALCVMCVRKRKKMHLCVSIRV